MNLNKISRLAFSTIVFLTLGVLFFFNPKTILAQECGLNIDPANPGGHPSPASLKGVDWVRIEYKDCTESFPPTESIDIFRNVLSTYKNAGIKTLVILDYLTYPGAATNIEKFGERVEYIYQELDGVIDAYQVWNEPDHCAQYCLEPEEFRNITAEIAKYIPANKIVLGGFASGDPGYLTNSQIPSNQYGYIGLHPYGKKVNGFWGDWTSGEMSTAVSQYKQAGGGKPVWITEIGFSSSDDSLQAEYLRRVYSSGVGADKIFWFAWSDAMVVPFGLTTASQIPKKSYDAFFSQPQCGGSIPSTISMLPAIAPPGGGGCGGVGAQPKNEEDKKPGPNDYITIPLILEPEKYAGDNKDDLVGKLLWNMVVDQGYEVKCASPELTISATAIGDIEKYFSEGVEWPSFNRFGNQVLALESQSDYVLDLRRATIPMYRDLDEKSPGKTASYEAFFGTLDPDTVSSVDAGDGALHTGVINNLLKPAQQCAIKLDNLRAAKNLCERLENPELCSLHFKIPKSKYYLYSTDLQESNEEKSLLTAIESWMANNSGVGCAELMNSYDSRYTIDRSEFTDIQDAVFKMSIDLEYVYRYAFIVLSPLQDVDDWCYMNNREEDAFWFLSNHQQTYLQNECLDNRQVDNYMKRIPSFVAIKIPTVATNEIESLPFLKNSASLTANTLGKIVDQENKLEALDIKPREQFLTDILQVKKEVWDCESGVDCEERRQGLVVDCQGMAVCEGAHGVGTELRKALVHMINGSKQTCEGETFFASSNPDEIFTGKDNPAPHGYVENVKVIGSAAIQNATGEDTDDPQRYFSEEYFNVRMGAAKNALWQWRLELKEQQAKDILGGLGETNDIVSESVRIHIVAPLGTELSYIENMLSSLFTHSSKETMIKENVMADAEAATGNIARYFPIFGTQMGFNDQANHHFSHEDCNFKKDEFGNETTEREICKSAGVKLSDDNVGLFMEGATLGWLIKQIQLGITRDNSLNDAYSYLASCKRIEDLFLGRCGDAGAGGQDSPGSSAEIDCPIVTLGWDDGIAARAFANKDKFLNEFINRTFTDSQGGGSKTFLTPDLFDYVINYIRDYSANQPDRSVNPALVLALGREETAWGAVGSLAVTGCLGTDDQGRSITDAIAQAESEGISREQAIIHHQVQCIGKNFKPPMGCEEFMCRYSGDGTAPCIFKNNPNFPKNFPPIYRSLIE